MASLRSPVPSVGLLRFLRQQTESLNFPCANHKFSSLSVGQFQSRKTKCSARYQPAPLRASVLDSRSLISSRSSRAVRIKRSPCQNAALRWQHNSPTRQPTPCKPAWKEWFSSAWGPRARRPGRPLEPDDLPEVDADGGNNSMFNNYRQLSKKAASEPRLRCTEVDENGNVILVDGEFKKTELIAKVYTSPLPRNCANSLTNLSIVWASTP